MIRRGLALAAALGLALLATVPADPVTARPTGSGRRPIVVTARPIEAFRPSEPTLRRFGPLEFLGGLVLASDDPEFGGLSGLRTADHGRELLAITDEGNWLAARLATDDAGRPTAIADVEMAPILDDAGRRLRGKRWADAESLTVHRVDGALEARVGFEGRHRVTAHRGGTDPRSIMTAPGRPVAVPAEIAGLARNEGLEAIADGPAGNPLVLIAEAPDAGASTIPGWIVGGPAPGRFRLATTDGFAATDAAFLPSGDLLVLQRRLSFFGGFSMRLVRIAAADLRPGATVVGQLLLASQGGDEIDNMEGLAVDTAPDGTTLVTLISDDNFFWLQNTVLLRFRLVD